MLPIKGDFSPPNSTTAAAENSPPAGPVAITTHIQKIREAVANPPKPLSSYHWSIYPAFVGLITAIATAIYGRLQNNPLFMVGGGICAVSSAIALFYARTANFSLNMTSLQKDLNTHLASIEGEVGKLHKDKVELEALLSKSSKQLQQDETKSVELTAEEKRIAAQTQTQIEALQNANTALEAAKASLTTEAQAAKSALSNLEPKLQAEIATRKQLEGTVTTLKEEIATLQSTNLALSQTFTQLQQEHTTSLQDIAQLQALEEANKQKTPPASQAAADALREQNAKKRDALQAMRHQAGVAHKPAPAAVPFPQPHPPTGSPDKGSTRSQPSSGSKPPSRDHSRNPSGGSLPTISKPSSRDPSVGPKPGSPSSGDQTHNTPSPPPTAAAGGAATGAGGAVTAPTPTRPSALTIDSSGLTPTASAAPETAPAPKSLLLGLTS